MGGTTSLGDDELFWDVVVQEHPVCLRHPKGFFGALMVSDFLTQRELHRTRLYDIWLRPFGVEHQLYVGIPSPPSHTKTFIFDRERGALQRARPACSRSPSAAPRPALASGADAAAIGGGARRPRSGEGRRVPRGASCERSRRARVRLGAGAPALCPSSPRTRRLPSGSRPGAHDRSSTASATAG